MNWAFPEKNHTLSVENNNLLRVTLSDLQVKNMIPLGYFSPEPSGYSWLFSIFSPYPRKFGNLKSIYEQPLRFSLHLKRYHEIDYQQGSMFFSGKAQFESNKTQILFMNGLIIIFLIYWDCDSARIKRPKEETLAVQ